MSIVLETALSVFLDNLVEGLLSVNPNMLSLGNNGKNAVAEIKKWGKKLKDLSLIIRDAQVKKLGHNETGNWLEDLEDLAYDIQDVLENFNYQIIRQQLKEQHMSCSFRFICLFKFFMLDFNLKKITVRLIEMEERKQRLNLLSRDQTPPKVFVNESRRYFTGPVQCESENYGRNDEKKAMIQFLSNPVKKIEVYPIVGMGGVGKTSLAQYAFNYEYQTKFDVKVWVCVSKDYNRLRINKEILEVVSQHGFSFQNPALVEAKIEEALEGKKFLIVLDDLWEIETMEWLALKAPFSKGGSGSKVVVTTRNAQVADTVRTFERYVTLTGLSPGDSWLLFCRHSGLDNNSIWMPNLEVVGRKIVEKCDGLPLAVIILGSLLRWKHNLQEWEDILKSYSLIYRDGMMEIMSVLRMSFDDLPGYLKDCFLLCAMFPEDYKFKEDQTVEIWLGAGLITCAKEQENPKYLKKLGHRYFKELVWRSLLHSYSDGIYSMHDLIRGMGQESFENKFCSLENGMKQIKKLRHLSFQKPFLVENVTSIEEKVLPLRTILAHGSEHIPFGPNKEMLVLLTKLKHLRVLSLPGSRISKLPKPIGQMKLLRYLNLSEWDELRELPSCIGNLLCLSHLNLSGCIELLQLPWQIKHLVNLSHFQLSGCIKLRELPLQIGHLVNLLHFDLRWCKCLEHLPSQIGNMVNLMYLNLSGCSQLQELPPQIGDLTNLNHLVLSECCELNKLPSQIGNLTNLHHLDISRCSKIVELPSQIGSLVGLSHLNLHLCNELQELPSEIRHLANLSHLDMSDCCELSELPSWIGNLTNLSHLNLSWCRKFRMLPLQIGHLTNLFHLDLTLCNELLELPSQIGNLVNLKYLCLNGCSNLERVPSEIGDLANLTHLDMRWCSELRELPLRVGELVKLSHLDLRWCGNLRKLPSEIAYLANLSYLNLTGCSQLSELPAEILGLAGRITRFEDCFDWGLTNNC